MKSSIVVRHQQGADLMPKQEVSGVSSPTENKKEPRQKERSSLSFSALYHFIGEIKSELQRINWTTADDLKVYVKVVVSVTFVFGLSIYGVDLVIQAILHTFRFLVHALFG